MMKQQSFFDSKSPYSKSRIAYGGKTKGRAKVFRPLDRKRPLHIVLKSSIAKGVLSLLSKRLKVDEILYERAKEYGVTIHRRENMGNHLHLMVSFKIKAGIQKFLRVITGLIARLMTKAERGKPFGKRFWDGTVFTRIVTNFRDRMHMHKYMNKNQVEREHGPAMREAMEMYDEVRRKARRRNVPLEVIYDELLLELEKRGPAF